MSTTSGLLGYISLGHFIVIAPPPIVVFVDLLSSRTLATCQLLSSRISLTPSFY